MQHMAKVVLCLFAAVCGATAAFAEGEEPAEPEIREGQLWRYDASTKKLTEIVPDGVTPWVFTLTAEGQITAKSSGANTTVDLRTATLPENAPVIVGIGDIRNNSPCETLYLPETLTSIGGCAFYQWTALKRVEFPTATDLTIGGLAFSGSLITNVVLPQTMKKLGDSAFSGCGQLVYVRLPDNLEYLGTGALLNCSKLAKVEPFLPRTLTYFGGQFSSGGGGVLGGELELGFGTNEVDQTPIMVERNRSNGRAFWGCGNVTKFRYGPGVTDLNTCEFYMCGKVTDVEVGCNVTNIHCGFPTSLKRVVFNCAKDFSLQSYGGNDSALVNCKSVTDVVFRAWCDYPQTGSSCPFTGWSAKQARFTFPLQNAKWLDYVTNTTKVTPWRLLSDADRISYYNKFGADAPEPFGLSIAVSGGLNAMWLVPEQSRKATFVLGELPVQRTGVKPVPEIFDADGTELSADDFDFIYLGCEVPDKTFILVIGREGTAHAGELSQTSYRCSTRTTPETFTWTKVGDGDWEDAANWSPAGFPILPGDSAVLPKMTDANETSYKVTVNERLDIASLTVGGDGSSVSKQTLEFKTMLATNRFASVTVKKDGTVTHFGPNLALTQRLILKVAGNLTVEAGGAIAANDVGSTAVSSSPNPGTGRCFGHHAGETDNYNNWGAGRCYGSIRHPVDYGAGAYIASAAAGAGSIYLEVARRLQVQSGGTVSASPKSNRNAAAAPAGGSIWLRVNELKGEGTIIAAGAKDTGSGGNWCGSGGRIAIYMTGEQKFSEFAGTVTTVNEDTSATKAAGGTVYVQEADEPDGLGTLIIDGRGRSVDYMTVLSKDVIGADEPFGSVILRNAGKLRVMDGTTLKVASGLALASKTAMSVEPGAALEFVGDGEATFTGASLATIETLICTNAGKTIRFGTAAEDKLTIAADKDFIMKGVEGNPVSLLSAVDGTPWQIAMNPNPGVVEVEYVAVKDSDASSGAPMLAIDSQNLGGNSNWGFSRRIVPGETISWTGAQGTKWDAVENWDLGRAPVETDAVSIPAVASGAYPVLPSGTYLYNRIDVGEDATFTLSGCALTVTNKLTVAGALVFSGNEPLYLAGDADFTGGSLTAASGTIYLTGEGDQTVDFGGCALNKLFPQKPSGDVSFGAHGFTAANLTCAATASIRFTFAAGQDYEFDFLSLASVGADRLIALVSSVPGTAWKLKVTASGQSVASVSASDCDASSGDTVMAGTKSEQSGCTNWDTETDTAAWVGGATGDFTDPSKWSTGTVPGPTTLVTVNAGEGETVTVTIPADAEGTVIKGLTVYAGAGGKATFAADAPITITDTMTIRDNGVVELNSFDAEGPAPNVVKDVHVFSGGILSHTGKNSAETKKLHLHVTGDLIIDAGGAVNVNDVGTYGKYYSTCVGSSRCYGRHAGETANNSNWGNGKVFGSVRRPFAYGGAAYISENGNGGGAVKLEVDGKLQIDGEITSSPKSLRGAACAPAGGSIWLEVNELKGEGTIIAAGAKDTGSGGNWCGSGGRIAIYMTGEQKFSEFAGTVSTVNPNSTATTAAGGTVYIQEADDTDGLGTLIVDGFGRSVGYRTALTALVTDAGEPFGAVIVRNAAKLRLSDGLTLRVARKFEVSANSSVLTDEGGSIEFVGTDDAVFSGGSHVTFQNFYCTNVAKRIAFGAGNDGMVTIPAGGAFKLSGPDADHPLVLEPLSDDPTATWQLNVHADATREFTYLAVSNSNASAGTSLLAIDSEDRGGNTYWSFTAPIHPDDPIRWTGAASTDWADVENWDLRRAPVTTDKVYIDSVGESGNYPVLASGTFAQNKVYVASGATLTLSDATLTVSNEFEMAGSLVFAGTETLHLVGNADFTGGEVAAAGSFVLVEGEAEQSLNLGDCVFRSVEVVKGGGATVFTGGFKADIFRCVPTVATELRFANGVMIDVKNLTLIGGQAKLLTLAGGAAGDFWQLKATTDGQAVAGVVVSGCDASSGAKVYAGTTSENAGGNTNWDFVENRSIWVGGDGSFMEPSNWATGVLPGSGDAVIVSAAEGETMMVTVPSGEAVSIGSLRVLAGDGGKATLVANAPLNVADDIEVCANGVLELNCYDNASAAPNTVGGDMSVFAGGMVTHSGPASSENAKLHLAVLGDLTVEAGASVDVTGKGHSSSTGMGKGGGYIGAAHAGYGYGGAVPYGSILRPFTWGSATHGPSGGGAIHLEVAGTLRADGDILADGQGNGTYTSAGGSVWIECGALVGGGLIAARDGLSGAGSSNYMSSGGRIAVYQRVAKGFAAFPVDRMSAVYRGLNAAGTIYLESADKSLGTHLYVLGGPSAARECTRVPMEDDGDLLKLFREVNLIVGPNAWVEIPNRSHVCFRDIELQAESSKLFVNGATVDVRSIRHLNRKNWLGSVDLGGTELYPGKINWIGGADGAFIWFR